jgi:hypothetical protein
VTEKDPRAVGEQTFHRSTDQRSSTCRDGPRRIGQNEIEGSEGSETALRALERRFDERRDVGEPEPFEILFDRARRSPVRFDEDRVCCAARQCFDPHGTGSGVAVEHLETGKVPQYLKDRFACSVSGRPRHEAARRANGSAPKLAGYDAHAVPFGTPAGRDPGECDRVMTFAARVDTFA